jgi:uncharacterized protein with PhoU and TrkA domain
MESVGVPQESPLTGLTLLELDLIHTVGVQIGGIRRGSKRILSPSGKDSLQGGDELLVLGTPAQIQDFRARLEPQLPAGQDPDIPNSSA